jgi:flagellar basal body-associated protein FliL
MDENLRCNDFIMRGVFMEKIVRRGRVPIILIVIVLVVAVLAAGAYFIFGRKSDKQPHRGTYVYSQDIKEYGYEETYQ